MVLFARRFLYQVNKRSLCGQGPHYFNAVPYLAIYLKADPSRYNFSLKCNPNPNPAPHQSDGSPRPPRLCFEPLMLMNFDFNADPDSVFHANGDPDPAPKNNPDPDSCSSSK